MKRRLLEGILIVLLAVVLCFTGAVSAEPVFEGNCGKTLTWMLDSEGTLAISGSGVMTDYSSGEAPWYAFRADIVKVVIDDGVTSIGDSAFVDCSNLTEVSVCEGVCTIGANAFRGCSSLAKLSLPDSTTKIYAFAFQDCSSLTGIRIPAGVETIWDAAFRGCTSLTEIFIPDSVTSVGTYLFYDCTALERVKLSAGMTTIGGFSFYNCSSLTDISIPEAVTDIGSSAFEGCTGLTGIAVPEGLRTIDARGFYGCGNLSEISLPDGMVEIGAAAFLGCSSLTELILPDSVTSIGGSAFQNCTNLGEITLPAGLTAVEDSTFNNCTSLTAVAIPDGVTDIGYRAFFRCSNLVSVVFPNSLRTVGHYAFDSCCKLREALLPDGVTSIGIQAFYCCEQLRSVTLPAGLTTLGGSAFSHCSSLTEITLPEGIMAIDSYTFYQCASLTELTIPSQVATIGFSAFDGCANLNNITIPGSVTSVQTSAFYGCNNLTDLYFDGEEAAWSDLNLWIASHPNVFFAEDYNENQSVEIQLEDVPGGVVVTMTGVGSGIYYTLDGTIPCSASIPYEGPFLLELAGEYFIHARSVDLTAMTYGGVSMDYIELEQSAAPEVTEQGGKVYLEAPGTVYYTLDLTQTPTMENYCYTEPLYFGQTTVFSARTIQTGFAPSPVISYTYYKPVDSGMDYPGGSYSFGNTRASFGYAGLTYKIPEIRYTEVFGDTMGQLLYTHYGTGVWNGSCFGMSSTALMFHDGQLTLRDYSDQAETVYELLAPASKDSSLTQLIERYQVAQFLPAVMAERNDASEGGTMVVSGIPGNGVEGAALVDAVRRACSGGEPIILIVQNNIGGFHAVVPYRTEGNIIYVYDCNKPGAEQSITYTVSSGGVYSFSYGLYSYSIAYNRLSTLLEGLENLQSDSAVLSAGEEEMMLFASSSSDLLVLDENGREVTDYLSLRATEDMASDYTTCYLKNAVYTVRNNAATAESWTISVATTQDFYTVTIADPTARVEVGEKFGRLCISVTADSATEILVRTSNSDGRENTLSVTATFTEFYACTEKAIQVRTNVAYLTANGEDRQLAKDENSPGMWFGAVAEKLVCGAREMYARDACVLRTDITHLPDASFVLTMHVSGIRDSGTLCIAGYEEDGRLIGVDCLHTEQGKTRYVCSIGAGADRVTVFLLENGTFVPLSSAVLLQ